MNHLHRNKYRYLLGLTCSSGGVMFFYQTHLQKTPITDRTRFILFNSEQLFDIEKFETEMVYFI